MLLPVAADDPELVADISALVNRAYEVAEEGLWHGGVARTTLAETSDAITAGEVVVARDDGRLVGSIRTHQLDSQTGWFGVLAVDQTQGRRGIGGRLVAAAPSEDLLGPSDSDRRSTAAVIRCRRNWRGIASCCSFSPR